MQTLAYLVYLAVQWKFAVIGALVVGIATWSFLSAQLFGRKKGGPGCVAILAGLALILLFAFFGNGLANRLVHDHGVPGEAIATDTFATGHIYNEQRVYGFNVLIRTGGGRVVRTSFRTDSFNVHPSRNQTRYPGPGARFNVRYLPDHPDAFVIIADDDSEWARSLRCGDLLQEVARAAQAANFAPGDAAFARARDEAVAAARAAGCIPG